jgi:pimeloyl-ACP methyl ester carboxylesterase
MSSFRLASTRIALGVLVLGMAIYLGSILWTWRLTTSWSEKETLKFSDGLRGVWLWPKAGKEPYPAVLFANGGTGTLEHNLPLAIELTKHGVACFLFDFGGQGGSKAGGQPEQDLAAAIAALKQHPRVDPKRLGAVGHSLGGRLITEHADKFRAEVVFGNLSERESPDILIAYSRFEFLFDPPSSPTVVVGPWTDHLSGPMDPVLLRASLDWLGQRLGFKATHPVTEPTRILARLLALLGGAFIVLSLLMFLPAVEPWPSGDAPIPSSFLWITSLGTMVLPVLFCRREKPVFRLSDRPRGIALLLGGAFFISVYLLSVAAFSWSYFDVVLHARKWGFFAAMSVVFTLIQWHDQALLHGKLIESPEISWAQLWRAGFVASACRWAVAGLILVVVLLAGGRPGIWMILGTVCIVTFWLESLAVSLSCRARHSLAGAAFLGMTWAWLWTVFLPM